VGKGGGPEGKREEREGVAHGGGAAGGVGETERGRGTAGGSGKGGGRAPHLTLVESVLSESQLRLELYEVGLERGHPVALPVGLAQRLLHLPPPPTTLCLVTLFVDILLIEMKTSRFFHLPSVLPPLA
jgi:hypothetical protein